jgi:hypothetical protein
VDSLTAVHFFNCCNDLETYGKAQACVTTVVELEKRVVVAFAPALPDE